MSRTHYSKGKSRHSDGYVRVRDTHTGSPDLFTPRVEGMSYADVRSGEQAQSSDVAPQVVETRHFNFGAFAPNVNNNPEDPGDAEVVIDGDGITIRNGKIFLLDYGGSSVLGPAGFAGSWIDFMTLGTYNGAFLSHSLEGATAATIVGTASTTADYEASLSNDLPYWVVSRVTSGRAGVLSVIGAGIGTASGGEALHGGETDDFEVFQDVPITPGTVYGISYRLGADVPGVGGGTGKFTGSYQFRDYDHAAIGSEFSADQDFSADTSFYNSNWWVTEPAPANARFIRVKVAFEPVVVAGGYSVFLSDLYVEPVSWVSRLALRGETANTPLLATQVDGDTGGNRIAVKADGTVEWSDGTNVRDISLSRQGTYPNAVLTLGLGDLEIHEDNVLQFGDASVAVSRDGTDMLLTAPSVDVSNDLNVGADLVLGNAAVLWVGSDAILYRSGANEISAGDGDTLNAQFLTSRGRMRLSSEIVSTVDANQNNYNPTGLATASRIRFTSLTASRTLTGLVAGTDGDLMFLTVNSTGPLVLAHESASSTATNRFRCPNSASVTIRTGGSVMLMYVNSRWTVIQP